MSKVYTTVIKLEAYPEKFENIEARNVSLIPTLYEEATKRKGLDVEFDKIQIVSVDAPVHDVVPLELHVKWQINP